MLSRPRRLPRPPGPLRRLLPGAVGVGLGVCAPAEAFAAPTAATGTLAIATILVLLALACAFAWSVAQQRARRIRVLEVERDALARDVAERTREVDERTRALADRTTELDARTSALAMANQSKVRFLAAASHDLRQPMHALNLFVAQLRAEKDGAERERLAARIESALANVNELFDSLLDISKLDAGVVAPNVSDFALARIFERVEATFEAAALAKGLDLVVMPTTVWVRSDPTLLERIVSNLVTNAVRYTRTGGVVVGVRRRGNQLDIEVVDTGVGISPDKQARIFAEFYQVSGSGSAGGEGLGLGLSIVERLCGLLGHRIALVSLPERGSRFRITVPRAAPQAPPVIVAPAVALPDPLRGRRVLVVDNDPLVLESTSGLLRSWGCDVVTADSGGAAMGALGDVPPDLVISDFHLGENEIGSAVVAALRMRFGDALPAFLVSGDIADATRDSARLTGLHLLEKPVSPMKLRAMATRLIAATPVAR